LSLFYNLKSLQDRLDELGRKVTTFAEKLEQERTAFAEARKQFSNSNLVRVEHENEELRQSVRIADNELRIMLHEEEVILHSYKLGSVNK
jgi:hypothetical protein